MAIAFFHGVLLAFGLILPLGVQNIFIFNQGAVQKKFRHALPAILTASLCDTFLIIIAILGVSVLLWNVIWLKTAFILIGSCFLLYLGYFTWKSSGHAKNQQTQEPLSAGKQMMFAASVSLLNPHAILDTIGVIGISALTYSESAVYAFAFGCIAVSWIWFFALSWAGRIVGKMDSGGRIMFMLNRLAAILIWLAAIYLLFSL
ncbi:LysE/ArgO family amino acid transporter [Brevibacillus daliensis]|uniref:LysE/ArgO family amino acid transporter n=1 Tax=Brevibacillus daliensis TaxID=2892995 RepID=UPI001E5ADD18|nr:LysE family transporter [Brevibacillus daliensis]